MLVQNLAITYKCYSSIGNSLNLKEMITEVLRTLVSETYASYAIFTVVENNKEKKVSSFGKINFFNPNDYSEYKNTINRIEEKDKTIVLIRLEYGSMFLITQNMDSDCSFYLSMFESLIHKLNLSIESCLNIEKIKEANILLQKQKEELEEANKAKDDFLANMSHELKTPLNSINVISSIMSKNSEANLSQKQMKNLQIINKCGKELLFLINDVLDISKLEAGEVVLTYEEVDLKSLINSVYDVFYHQVKDKGLDFNVNINTNIEFIRTDKIRLNQVIYNLLSNALKFTKKGAINIHVTDDKNNNVIIEVSDDGIGIPEEKLLNIFDRFKQVDGSTTRIYGGTGLGLSICKELMTLLNGNIKVESSINKGTTFQLIIPRNSNKLITNIENTHLNKIDNYTFEEIEQKEKENIIVFNDNPLEFFPIVITLNKKYKVNLEDDFYSFLKFKRENNIKKAIVDSTRLSKKEKEILSKDSSSDFIFLYSEKLDENLIEKCLLSINKEQIDVEINKI